MPRREAKVLEHVGDQNLLRILILLVAPLFVRRTLRLTDEDIESARVIVTTLQLASRADSGELEDAGRASAQTLHFDNLVVRNAFDLPRHDEHCLRRAGHDLAEAPFDLLELTVYFVGDFFLQQLLCIVSS